MGDEALLEAKARTFATDLASLDLDLAATPLKEILAHREEFSGSFAEYSLAVDEFVLDSLLASTEESARLRERERALRAERDRLNGVARKDLGAGSARILSLAAGVAAVLEGSYVSGALAFMAALLSKPPAGVTVWSTSLSRASVDLDLARSATRPASNR